jgi:tetratricopeptide (TPR) repeat protein
VNYDVFAVPVIILIAGASVGALLAFRSGSGTSDIARSREADNSAEYAQTLAALKQLDSERHKLNDATYTSQRKLLLDRAAGALRRIEDPNMDSDNPLTRVRSHLAGQRETLGNDAVDAALAALSDTRAPARTAASVSPAWLGALYTLVGVAVLGGLYLAVSSSSVERTGNMSITGIDPSNLDGPPPQAQLVDGSASPGPVTVPPEVIEFRARVQANPNDVEARNRITEYAIGAQDLAEAMAQNGEVMQIEPTNQDGRVYRAYLMMSIGRTDEAIDMLEALLGEHPDNVKANIYYGLMTLTAGQPDKAIPALEMAIAQNPEGVDFLQERLASAREMLAGGPQATGDTAPTAIASGQLRMEGDLFNTLQPTDALFISVRDPAGGPPLAAQRLSAGPFPMAFSITEADRIRMGGDRPLPAIVDVSFRVDRDGDAMTREPDMPLATMRGLRVGSGELFVELALP